MNGGGKTHVILLTQFTALPTGSYAPQVMEQHKVQHELLKLSAI